MKIDGFSVNDLGVITECAAVLFDRLGDIEDLPEDLRHRLPVGSWTYLRRASKLLSDQIAAEESARAQRQVVGKALVSQMMRGAGIDEAGALWQALLTMLPGQEAANLLVDEVLRSPGGGSRSSVIGRIRTDFPFVMEIPAEEDE